MSCPVWRYLAKSQLRQRLDQRELVYNEVSFSRNNGTKPTWYCLEARHTILFSSWAFVKQYWFHKLPQTAGENKLVIETSWRNHGFRLKWSNRSRVYSISISILFLWTNLLKTNAMLTRFLFVLTCLTRTRDTYLFNNNDTVYDETTFALCFFQLWIKLF